MLALFDKAEKIRLQFVAVDLREGVLPERGDQVFAAEPVVLFERRRLDERLFHFQPLQGEFAEVCSLWIFDRRGRGLFLVVQCADEFFVQRSEVPRGYFDVQVFSAHACLVHAVLSETVGDDDIFMRENFTVFYWHLFHLLFCESDACLLPAPRLRGFFFFSLDFSRLGVQKRGEYLLGKGLGGKL